MISGTARFEALSVLLDGGLRTLGVSWRMSEKHLAQALSSLRGVVGSPMVFGSRLLPPIFSQQDTPRGVVGSPVVFGSRLLPPIFS